MENFCKCTAYPFPHRPGGGKCVADEVIRLAYDKHELHIELMDVEFYSGEVVVYGPLTILAELERDLGLIPLVWN